MPRPLVLVITSQPDTHINEVGKHLEQRGVEWIRLNTEDLFTNSAIDIDPRSGSGRISIKDSGRSFSIEDVAAIWYRKPDTPSTSHLSVSEDHERKFFDAEAYEGLLSLYAVLQDRPWINNPMTTRLAFRRFHQLKVATRLGMRTVRSIFSNDETAVVNFADDAQGKLAIKALSAMSVVNSIDGHTVDQYGVLTRTIDRDDLEMIRPSIAAMPTFLQEYVDKRFDLRIVVVDQDIFACRIHSQANTLTQQDFRIGTKNLKHELIDIAEDHSARIFAFMKELGIDFGCFDFLEVEDGAPYFLECNPNGQWLWIEQRTGAPIAEAIADRLCRLAGTK